MQTRYPFSPVQRDDGLAHNNPTAAQAVCILTVANNDVFQSAKNRKVLAVANQKFRISESVSDAEAEDDSRLIDV